MENLKFNNIWLTKIHAQPMFIFCCSLIFRWRVVLLLQVESRQGEKPYAYEVKRPQATALTRASNPQSPHFSRWCGSANQTCSQHGPAAQPHHCEPISGHTSLLPPHMTPVTSPQKPRAPFDPDRWQTAAMLAPCQPAGLAAAYSFPGSQRHACLWLARLSQQAHKRLELASPPSAGGCLSSLAAPPPLHLLPTSWYHGGGCKPDSGLARPGAAPTSAAAKRRLPLENRHN